MQAHEPETVRLPGWDPFENSVWLAGGVVAAQHASCSCCQRPRFQSPQEAKDWMVVHQHRSGAALDALR